MDLHSATFNLFIYTMTLIDGHQSLLKHIINPMKVFSLHNQAKVFVPQEHWQSRKLFGHHMDGQLFVCR
jgi:hypothetical protein